MAIGIDMFGTGGEGLGGLFVGNQMAMDRDRAMMDQQKGLADIASSQAMTRQRELTNQLDEALLPGKIEDAALARTQKQEADKVAKFNASGEQFGKLGMTLGGIPAAARPAALRQMAASAGIGDDNPMLNMFMNMDPEQMPDAMAKFSQGFFEQGDKARVEAQKRGLMMEQKRAELASKEAEGEANRQMRRDIAADSYALRRDIAAMTQAGQDRRASAKGAAKGPTDILAAAAAGKIDPKKVIAYYAVKEAQEGLTPEEVQARDAMERLTLSMPGAGKSEAAAQMGLAPSQQEKVKSLQESIRGGKSPSSQAAPLGAGDIPKISDRAGYDKLPSGSTYIDPNGVKRTKK